MSFVYLFILFLDNHDIGSQIPPSLEMTNLRQESMGHKRWILLFQSIFLTHTHKPRNKLMTTCLNGAKTITFWTNSFLILLHFLFLHWTFISTFIFIFKILL